MSQALIEVRRLSHMIRLGRGFLRPDHPTTYKHVKRFIRIAQSGLNAAYGPHSEQLKRFEQYFRRANDPYQSPSVERGGVEKTLEALDRAGRDAVTTFNKPALEDTLRVLRQAIRHAAGQLEAANNSAAAPSEQVDDRPSPVESPLESATPSEMVNGSGPDVSPQTEQQALIQKFMDRVLREKKKRIRKTDIWRLAGYTEATEFERYQRNDPKTSDGARHKFGLILSMDPEKFLERLAEAHSK